MCVSFELSYDPEGVVTFGQAKLLIGITRVEYRVLEIGIGECVWQSGR